MDTDYYTEEGFQHSRHDQWNRATGSFTVATYLQPDNPKHYQNRGWTLRHVGEYGESIEDFTKAIELDPDNEWLRDNRPPSDPFPPSAPIRGIAGDLWVDVVLGKPTFSEIAANQVVPFRLFNPGGVLVVRSTKPGRAYIWDSGNSRVLGMDLAECYEGETPCSADLVIGQPSLFDHSACNGAGRLWVLGFEGKHFIDVYQLPLSKYSVPIHTMWAEDRNFPVLGTGAETSIRNSIFGIRPIGGGELLWLSDTDNHRVLRIRDPLTNPVVDVILGQSDHTGVNCNRIAPLTAI